MTPGFTGFDGTSKTASRQKNQSFTGRIESALLHDLQFERVENLPVGLILDRQNHVLFKGFWFARHRPPHDSCRRHLHPFWSRIERHGDRASFDFGGDRIFKRLPCLCRSRWSGRHQQIIESRYFHRFIKIEVVQVQPIVTRRKNDEQFRARNEIDSFLRTSSFLKIRSKIISIRKNYYLWSKLPRTRIEAVRARPPPLPRDLAEPVAAHA